MRLSAVCASLASLCLKRICSIVCLLMALTAVAAEQSRKCIAAPFVSGGVTVDGVLDESVWQKATLFTDFYNPKNGKTADSRTEARVFFDENYLYLGLKCFDKRDDLTVTNAHGYSLWKADYVEFFLGSLEPEPWSAQFVWGPGSAVYGAGPHWETKSRIEENFWTSETRIKLSALPLKDSVTGFHLVRSVRKSRTTCQFSHVGVDYQSIQNYAELILGSYAQAAFLKFRSRQPETLSREAYEKLNAELTVPRHKIVRGPWLFDATEKQMSIGWYTAGRTGGLVEYRKKGEKKFKTVFSNCQYGQLEHDRRLHKVQLTGLEPGAVYEYRIKNVNRHAEHFVQYPADGSCYTFTTHGKKDLSFLVFSDVHSNGHAWKSLLHSKLMQDCDLIVNIGDMLSNSTGILSIFHGYLDAQLPFAKRKPLLNFRGNHENRGTSPATFDKVFASPGWPGYSLHRFGDVCLIGMDLENAKQREWLKEVVKTPEFQTAKHRIVLNHYPAIRMKGRKILEILDGIFIGKDRLADIDLYLCGHRHRGAFVAKNTDQYTIISTGKTTKIQTLPFAMIVNEGPNYSIDNTAMLVEAKGDSLTVKLLKRDGSIYHTFKIK